MINFLILLYLVILIYFSIHCVSANIQYINLPSTNKKITKIKNEIKTRNIIAAILWAIWIIYLNNLL